MNMFACDIAEPPDRSRICHHTEDKISLYRHFFSLHPHRISLNICQLLDAFQYICQMPKNIFHILAGLIGYIGKESECCNIHKIIVIKSSNIAREFIPRCNMLCSLRHAGRYLQAVGKIIGASTWNIADGAAVLTLHHSTDDFVQCPVSSAADNQLIFSFHLFCLDSGIPGRLGNIKCQVKICFDKNVYNIQQFIAN